jgi:hydroxymethylpyrimidine pyrophosphatase-like HAD family hydrolase
VLHLPASGYSTTLGPPPFKSFLQELTNRAVPDTAGECIVEAGAEQAHSVLDAIRSRELPLAMLFNRGRLMVLPQAISKATGLREILAMLRLSLRSTVGIGDAENDRELLRVCELGLAVAWGSPSLRADADALSRAPGRPILPDTCTG